MDLHVCKRCSSRMSSRRDWWILVDHLLSDILEVTEAGAQTMPQAY